jgi:predicted nucleotidyltransferase
MRWWIRRQNSIVELPPGLTIEGSVLGSFAKRWGSGDSHRRCCAKTSVRSSDIDMLVEFSRPNSGLLQLARMELELEAVPGRQVDLRT